MQLCGVKKSYLIFLALFSCTSFQLFSEEINNLEKKAQTKADQSNFLKYIDEVLGKRHSDMIEVGIKNGVLFGAQETISITFQALAGPILQEAVRPVGSCIRYPFQLATKLLQHTAFGSRRLAWNDVARLNNTVYELVQPLTQQSLGDFTKERRAELIAAKKDNEAIIDKDWQLRKDRLVAELEYVIKAVDKKMVCYASINQKNVVRKALSQIYGMFSVEQREEMAQYLLNAKEYCSDIKNILNDIQAIKQLEEHRDLIKFLLARALRSFKMVAMFIDEDVASMPAGSHHKGYAKFQELNAQGNGSLAGLDELFAGAGAAGAAS